MSQDTHEFVKKVFEKSGIDHNGSYLPKNLHPQHTLEPHGGQDESFAEARLVMGGAVADLLQKTGAAAGVATAVGCTVGCVLQLGAVVADLLQKTDNATAMNSRLLKGLLMPCVLCWSRTAARTSRSQRRAWSWAARWQTCCRRQVRRCCFDVFYSLRERLEGWKQAATYSSCWWLVAGLRLFVHGKPVHLMHR